MQDRSHFAEMHVSPLKSHCFQLCHHSSVYSQRRPHPKTPCPKCYHPTAAEPLCWLQSQILPSVFKCTHLSCSHRPPFLQSHSIRKRGNSCVDQNRVVWPIRVVYTVYTLYNGRYAVYTTYIQSHAGRMYTPQAQLS